MHTVSVQKTGGQIHCDGHTQSFLMSKQLVL